MTVTSEVRSLQGRKILLCVGGGIAAYKALELVRRLRERGALVQVAMTEGAQQFVTPLSFQALSGQPVRTMVASVCPALSAPRMKAAWRTWSSSETVRR